jgi:hypothetical protein
MPEFENTVNFYFSQYQSTTFQHLCRHHSSIIACSICMKRNMKCSHCIAIYWYVTMVLPIVWNLHTVTETFRKLCLIFYDVYVTCIKIFYSMSVFLWKLTEVFGCHETLMTCVSACCSVVPSCSIIRTFAMTGGKEMLSVTMQELF